MRSLLLSLALLWPLVLGGATPTPGTQAASDAPDLDTPDLDTIVSKHIAARGGAEKIAAIQSLMLTGRLAYGADTGGGTDSPITVRIQRPNQIRQDFIVQTHAGVRAYDGKVGWQRLPSAGTGRPTIELLAGPELKNIQDEAENGIDGPLVNAREKGHKLALAGQETFDGKPCYVVKVTLRTGHVMRLYLDTTSFLEAGERLTRSMNGRDVEIVETVSDYRDVGGVLFPHLYVSGTADRPGDSRLKLEKIVLNPPLDDMIFKAPTPDAAAPRKSSTPPAAPPASRKKPAAAGPSSDDPSSDNASSGGAAARAAQPTASAPRSH